MTGRMEVFARVLMRARIAAADVPAGQAHAQVRPRLVTEFDALLAFAGCKRFRLDPGCSLGDEMFACLGDRRGACITAA
jgi:hypothetical protein